MSKGQCKGLLRQAQYVRHLGTKESICGRLLGSDALDVELELMRADLCLQGLNEVETLWTGRRSAATL